MSHNAKERYSQLSSDRHQFLDTAVECSELTLPHLITDDLRVRQNHKRLITPWQSVGAKSVVTLAAKLMLALLPPKPRSSNCKYEMTSWEKNFQQKLEVNSTCPFPKWKGWLWTKSLLQVIVS